MDFRLNLNGESVSHAFVAGALCVEATRSVRDVMGLLRDQNRGAAIICEDGRVVGIFTERDALRAMSSQVDFDVPIRSLMTANPTTMQSNDAVGKAISKMSYGGYRRLPIVDAAGKPVGVLKTSGILHYLVEHFPAVIYNLPPAPHHVSKERDGA